MIWKTPDNIKESQRKNNLSIDVMKLESEILQAKQSRSSTKLRVERRESGAPIQRIIKSSAKLPVCSRVPGRPSIQKKMPCQIVMCQISYIYIMKYI